MNPLTLQIIAGTLVGTGAGYLGAFMVLRRMSLVGDALSHVALPGIAVALMLNINPFVGGFFALALAVVGIWALERRTALPSETLVGILFTVSLALGLLITPEPELLEALFGNISAIGMPDVILTLVLVGAIITLMPRIAPGLMLDTISPELARSSRVKTGFVNFMFLMMVAIMVALGLKVAGTLLMGSLVIIPAAAAKNIAFSLKHYTFSAGAFGAFSGAIGILAGRTLGFPPGPIVVLTSGLVFLVSIFFSKRN